MTLRLIRTLLTLAAGLSLASACVGFGDNSAEVRFHNATDVALNVYESDGRRNGPTKFVESGKTVTNQWVIPPVYSGNIEGAPRQVQASTASGELVFCHRFGYDELQRLNWNIEITRRNDCN
jgi:hypothetical protein